MKIESKVLVVQLGARNHYAEALALHKYGRLARLCTDFYLTPQSPFSNLLRHGLALPGRKPAILRRGLERHEATLPSDLVKSLDLFGIGAALIARCFPQNWSLLKHVALGSAFCHLMKRSCSLARPASVYCFNSAALEVFQWAKSHGIRCTLAQISLPKEQEQALVAEEFRLWPDWQIGLL